MKRILSVLLIFTLIVVCSNILGDPLEERILDEQILNSVAHDSKQVMFGNGVAGITTRNKFHIGWPVSHGKSRWGYSFWYDSKSEAGGVLMDKFRTQILNALQQSGAAVVSNEDVESLNFPFGFRIEYEKSKVTGEVSVNYGIWAQDFHLFEVAQSEVQ